VRSLKVRTDIKEDLVVIELPKEALALSTTVLGGIKRVRNVIFKKVPKNFSEDPETYVKEVLKSIGMSPEDSLIFLTAAELRKSFAMKDFKEFFIASTISYNPLACVGGLSKSLEGKGSTINVLVVVERSLQVRTLAELLSLVSETKTLALSDLCFSCSPTRRALQSAVDATAVATLGEPPEIEYIGPITELGSKISEALYNMLVNKLIESLDLNKKVVLLTGLSLDDIIDLALKIYQKAPVPGIDVSHVKSIIKSIIVKELKDPNIWALLSSYRCPEQLSSLGFLPNLSKEEYERDSTKIVSDEVLGIGLSLYINGIRGLLAYYWIDRSKKGIEKIKDLPPFLDDIVSAFLGGILSKVYDMLLGGEV
jgi:alpha-ribazole phosphatase CobZ